jgi:hypothetical protein
MASPDTGLADDLRDLHDAYVFKVNAAIADGRTAQLSELSDAYIDDAQRAIVAAETAT